MRPPLVLASPFLLAPMAGISTAGARTFFIGLGAGAASTGLIDAEGLVKDSPGSLRRASLFPAAAPQILQVFTADAAMLARAAERALELGYQGVELNLGCPAAPVVARGCGAALLGKWSELRVLFKALASSSGLPAGVKCRSGRHPGETDFLILHELVAEAGLDWFCLHPRSLAGAYEEAADWGMLDRIPPGGPALWAVGDLKDAGTAQAALVSHPGLDAVLLGRAAISRPWIFRQCLGGSEPGVAEKASQLTELLRILASDLDWQEAGRILPALLEHFGIDPGRAPQFRLVDRRRQEEWRQLLEQRLSDGDPSVMVGNPFLRGRVVAISSA